MRFLPNSGNAATGGGDADGRASAYALLTSRLPICRARSAGRDGRIPDGFQQAMLRIKSAAKLVFSAVKPYLHRGDGNFMMLQMDFGLTADVRGPVAA